MSENERAYSLTLKADKGYEAPWLVIQADTIEVLHDRLKAVQEGAFFATAGSAAKDFQAAYQLGKQLGGEPVSPPKEPTKKAPPKKQEAAPAAEPAQNSKPAEEKPAPQAAPAANAGGRPVPAWKR